MGKKGFSIGNTKKNDNKIDNFEKLDFDFKDSFKKYFGVDFLEFKGKEVDFDLNELNGQKLNYNTNVLKYLNKDNDSFQGTITGNFKKIDNNNGDNGFLIEIEDNNGSYFYISFNDINEIDGYDYKNLRVDYQINFKDGFEYKGMDHWSFDEGDLKDVKDFLESYIGNSIEEIKSKVEDISVCHYAKHIEDETDPIELIDRDFSYSIEDLEKNI